MKRSTADNRIPTKRTTIGPGWKDIMLFYDFDFASILEYYNLTYTVSEKFISVSSPDYTMKFLSTIGSLVLLWQNNPDKEKKYYIILGRKTSVGLLNIEKHKSTAMFTWECIEGGVNTCTKYYTDNIGVERTLSSFDGPLNDYHLVVDGKKIDIGNASDDQITEYMDVRNKMKNGSDYWELLRSLNTEDMVDFKNQNECIGHIYIICENMKKVKNN